MKKQLEQIYSTQKKFNQLLSHSLEKKPNVLKYSTNFFKYTVLYSSVLVSINAFSASQITPPGDVTDANTAMYTMDDIYHRLNNGTEGVKRTTVFTEPSSGPSSSGFDLNDIMGIAPVVDNADGANAAEVLNGKSFWGLRSDGTWGTTSGTRYPAPLMKTGQTKCYSSGGIVENPCISVGQDGDLQEGEEVVTRFSDNGDGTVTDNLTGLTWLKDASCTDANLDASGNFDGSGNFDASGSLGIGNWKYGLAISNMLKDGVCGLSDSSSPGDWRMPNIRELRSLIDYGKAWPSLPSGHPFSDVKIGKYWSSTSSPLMNNHALVESYYDSSGMVLWKNFNAYTWPVK